MWYRRPLPTKEIARQCGVTSDGIYLLVSAALTAVRSEIFRGQNQTLKDLADVAVPGLRR